MSLTGGGDHMIRRLVDVSGEHWTLRGGELGTVTSENQVELSQFLKFRNCESQFQGRNRFFSMNWPNIQHWLMVRFPQNEELAHP